MSEIDRLIALADVDAGVEAYGQALERLLEIRASMGDVPIETRFAVERRIAAALERLGRAEEAHTTARGALDTLTFEIPALERARCLLIAGKSALDLGLLPTARADAKAVLDTLGQTSLLEEAGSSRNLLGTVAFRSGEPDAARKHFERALEIFRKIGDLQHLAGTYVNLGNLHKLRCDWERAAEHYQLAYYLGTTLGESGVVAGSAQSLGIALSKTGRNREARRFYERGLKLSLEMGDSVRVLRARLALAKLDRSELVMAKARERLAACRETDVQSLPQREHCLLLLEQTRLDLEEGLLEHAAALAAELRLRVEAMAPRGDLMVEVLLLEADMAASAGEWEEAREAAGKARDLAMDDGDRAQQERAQLRLAIAWAHTGRVGEAETVLSGLVERHRGRGEWPAVAMAIAAEGEIANRVHEDWERAADLYAESAEVYRRFELPRAEALVEANRIECMIRSGRHEEALAQIEILKGRCEEREPFPALNGRIERLTELLRGAEADDYPGGRPDGLQVHEKLEEILAAPGSAWERLLEILSLLREALEVDRVFLGRVEGDRIEILASAGLAPDRGNREVSLEEFGLSLDRLDHPVFDLDLQGSHTGNVGSRLSIPMKLRGRNHLLHLYRAPGRSRSPLSRAESNYAMVLAAEVARSLELGTPENEEALLSEGIALADVITQDSQMIQILELIRRIGDTELSVLLQGETGTGKKLLAHAIHRASERRNRPIVTVDCAALPETLLEAELFGYRKGAFTGANQDRTGLLAEAAGGTVFLDEIDKTGLTVQRRFLHLLDSGEIRPVGSTSYLRLDIRIICATSSSDLREEVGNGLFLKDLYYRLNDISIQIPPLRERLDDILLLAGSFIETYADRVGRKIRGMSSGFRKAIQAHDWPGNVRELEKAIRRAVTLADDEELLTPELLPREALQHPDDEVDESSDDLRQQVEAFELRAITRALQVCDGNKSRAAIMLGLSRKGLKGKMARYGIGGSPNQGGESSARP